VPRLDSYSAVFDAAVALLAGRVLRGSEVEDGRGEGGAWGVVSCNQALGAFDPRSEAWCGRDGIPHRWDTYEAAAKWARGMTGSSYEGNAYEAMEIPSKPRMVIAGRHCSAVDDSLSFECVDWTNGPGDLVVVGSAYDAAAAFVALLGERITHAALSDAA
jgi:hypothetical protein